MCSEMLKAEDQEKQHVFQGILQEIWDSDEIPIMWKIATKVKIPKKGNAGDFYNWRGITHQQSYFNKTLKQLYIYIYIYIYIYKYIIFILFCHLTHPGQKVSV